MHYTKRLSLLLSLMPLLANASEPAANKNTDCKAAEKFNIVEMARASLEAQNARALLIHQDWLKAGFGKFYPEQANNNNTVEITETALVLEAFKLETLLKKSQEDLNALARLLAQKVREFSGITEGEQYDNGDTVESDEESDEDRNERLLRVRLRNKFSGSPERAADRIQYEADLFAAVEADNVKAVKAILEQAKREQKSDVVHLRDQRGLFLYILKNFDSFEHDEAWCYLYGQPGQNKNSSLKAVNVTSQDCQKLLWHMKSNLHYKTLHGGFTPLAKAAGRGNKELASLLVHSGAIVEESINLQEWMVDPEVEINAEGIAARLGWKLNDCAWRPAGPNMLLADFIAHESGMSWCKTSVNPLSLAAIGGHNDVVELLLQSITARARSENEGWGKESIILHAIHALSYYGGLHSTGMAEPLFQFLIGSPSPKNENYIAIARALTKALIANAYPDDLVRRLGNAREDSSPEIRKIIDEEVAQASINVTLEPDLQQDDVALLSQQIPNNNNT